MANTPVVVLDDTLTDIADAIRGKNGSSDVYKPSEMPAAITAIPSGGGGSGVPREVSSTGVYGFPAQQFAFSLPSTATDLIARALAYAFYDCTSLTSVNFSSLTAITGVEALTYAFRGCTALTSVNLSSLTTVSGGYAFQYCFNHCTSLTSVDLSSLTTVSGQTALGLAFSSCTSLTSVDLSSLTTVTGSSALNSMFANCTSLTSVDLSSLTTITGSGALTRAFQDCTSLSSVSFPALTTSSFGTRTDQFNNMLSGCSGVTVHFPAAIQSTIGSWASVTGGFGGTNTTVLFDL